MRLRVVLSAVALAVASPGARAAPDPDIQAAVQAVSAERIQRSIYVLSSFRTRHTLSDPLPSGDGIGGAASWIRAEFERVAQDCGGRLKVGTDTFTQPARPPGFPQPASLTNLVAMLPGEAGPGGAPLDSRVFVVCAHYDSRSGDPLDASGAAPGADDDASGVAAVLELARVLAPFDARATVVFLLAAGGEQGQAGAAHWAAAAKARGLRVSGVFDEDCIGLVRSADGSIHRHSVRLFAAGPGGGPGFAAAPAAEGGENDTPTRELARFVGEGAAAAVPSMAVTVLYRADGRPGVGGHRPFLQQGYAAVRFTEDAEDSRHLGEADAPDGIDFPYVADVVRVNVAALLALARAPAPPQGVSVRASDPGGDAVLAWTPAADPLTTGYRIVWRASAASAWEHALGVSGGGTARTELKGVARDTGVFGVEAVDAAGHASPAAFAAGGAGP